MLKEINEQPAVMRRIIQEYEEKRRPKIDPEIVKDVANCRSYIYHRKEEQVIMQV